MSNALFSRLRQREQEQEAQRAAFRERTQELIRQRTTNEAVGSVGVVESMKPSSEVVNIARQRNMSVNFAHQNQSQILEAEKRQRTFEMLQNAPMLGQFLRDPNRAAAVQDSLDELAELERNLGVQITANQLLRAQGRLVSRDTQRRITNNNPAVEQHYAANLENDFSIVQGYAAQQAAQGERIFSGEATEDFKGAIGAFFAGTLPLAFKSLGETSRVGAEFAAERIEAGPDWMQDAILWQQIPIKAAQFALKQSPIYQTDIGRQILDYELPTASEYFRTQEAIFGELEQAGEAAMEFLEPEELNFAQKVTGALGQIATQVVVSSLNPATGAAMMTSQGASQQISRMEAQGIDASSKPLAIIAGGATTYILENLRLNSIFKAMPSELKGAAAKGFFSSLRRVGVQTGQEAVQEATETVIQNVIALFAYDSDAKIFEGAGEGAAVGGTAAAIFQTFVELALPRRARTNLTEQEAQQLSEAHQIVSAAAATKSNKDAVEEFINNANETQTVDIDAEGFQELYQSDPEGTRTMLQALGVSEEQMVEAMSGNSITLPAAKLMTMEDKGQFDQILDITRTSEGGMTPQEARREIEEGLGPELTEKLQQITEENIEQQRDETIARDVQTQLIAAGRSKQEAKAAGKIWSSAFASLEAMGVDSKAIYEKLELRINDTTETEQAASLLPQAQEEGSEARMQRARDMGFDTDTVLYRGSGADETTLRVSQGYEARTIGVSLTPSSETASFYANLAGGDNANVAAYYVKKGDFIDIDDLFLLAKNRLDPEGTKGDEWLDRATDEYLTQLAKDEGYIGSYWNDSGIEDYRVFDPKNIRSVNAAFDPDFADEPTLLAQTSADLQQTPVRIDGTGSGGRVLNWDFAKFLTDRHMDTYGRVLDPSDPDDYDTILQSLLQDYEEQTAQEDTGDAWYTDDINKAIELTSQIYPELNKPEFRDLFLTVTALLSPRQKPAANWENAILALRSWAETGRLELAKPNGKQFGVEAQRTSLELFQYMIDTMGLEEATKWVQSKHTGREMAEIRMQSGIYRKDAPSDKAKDYLPSETNLTEAKLGIYMFGPKVGDFMQNSVGIDQSAVTVDLWAARTYNRYIGRLMDVAPKLAEAKQIQSDVRGRAERQNITKLFREAAQQVGIDPSAMQAALWYFEQRLYRVHGIKSDSQNFSDAARKSLTQRGIDVFTGRDQQAESRDVGTGATVVSQKEDGVGSERAGDGGRRLPSGRFARLEGSPTVRAATGPIPRIVEVADKYARDNGIPAGRQAQYARVDEERAERIAQAYEEMEHNPSDPAVQAAYNDLVRQTIAQYEALLEAGYQFYFIDINSDVGLEYVESPFNAMRELRADQRMGVFPTDEGFGTLDADVDDNPLLATTKYQWPFGSPDGELRPVTANDLFRAVHDALGHGLEGAGFRARGEENAWQAHVRLYTGAAVGAMTSETRGQNSWLNYGPYGETNRTAKTEDTVFADQKTGLMPEWTWTEGRVPDMQPDPRSLFAQEGGTTRGTTRIMGELGSGSVLGTSPTIVKLLEAANQTTFLHESAHVFLEIYAALEQENAQVAEMMVPLREWLGWEVGQPLTVEMHEKFAGREEGFELYIKTGKAPSTALEKAFEAFRKWFNQIYQSVRGMANNLDPRAREFFDRMLATEEEIAEAQMKFHDSMTETVRDFMSPEQREKHRELQALAKKVATDKLFRKHLEQMQKSEKKQYKKDKEKISEQVRAEVSESPVFKAMSALADTESPVKLNRQATLDILGDERIVPVEPYLSEEGIDPELFAASFGYDTADQMFAEIAEDPDYDEIVEIEARRRMDDLQSDLLINQESAQAEAIEASFNDAQVRKLKVELDAIAEKALKETIPLAAIRKRARDIIDTKPLNEIIKPGKYALQAMNLHKKAIKAAATQKWDDAFRLTQQAMLQHHLARYAFQARTEVEKGNRFLARFALHRKLDPKKIAPEFIQRIRAMMELPTASPERQAQIRQDLQMFEEQQAENNFPVALPSQVYADQDMTERRSMTLEQFREFRDSIRNLNKGGRLQSEQAKAIATKISTEAADAIFASWGKRNLKGYSRSKKFGENIGSFLRQGDAAIIRLPYLAAWLQGRKDKQPIGMVRGVIVDTLYNDLSVAVNAKEKRLAALDEALLAIFKKHKISKNEIHAKVNVPEIETGGQITKNELFSLLLNMGTASNKQRVTDDVTLQGNAEQLLRMLENRLDKKYFDAAQDIWDLINTQRNDLGAVHLRRTGVTPTWVEAEQLVTKYGTYAGGYYPLKYDPKADANRDLNERKQEDVFKQNSHGIAAKAQTKSGMLKERLTNVKRPLYLNIDALIEHFAETATFIEMSEPIDAAWNLANSRQFGEALSQTWGSEYIEAVKTILRRSAADAVESGELGSKWLDKMLKSTRINASIAILGLNLPTAALAPVSIFQTVIPRYGIKVFARGMVEFAKRGVSFAIDSANTMEKKSPFMRERTRLINREAHDIAKRKISEGVWNKAQAAGFVPMVQIEKYTVSGPLWWGVYKTSLMDGLSEQQAIAAADTAVGTTQGSGRVIDLSVMQSSTSELSKATLTFMYGYVSGYYGVVRTDVALAETNIAKTMQIVKHLMVLNVLASTIETLIRQGLWEDDEEDAFLLAILSRMGRNSVLVPALSNFLSRYSSTTALEDVVKKGRQSAEYGWKSYDFESGEIDGEKAQKAAMKALQAFGFAKGVPGMTQMDRVISVYEEDDDPTLPEYLITGPDDDN